MTLDPVTAVGARTALVEIPLNQPMQATVFQTGHGPTGASGLREAMSALEDMGSRVLGSSSEAPGALLAGVERAALASITPQDYLRTSLAATDLSMHVSIRLMKLHLSSSLGGAVTGLFNTLLKNRD